MDVWMQAHAESAARADGQTGARRPRRAAAVDTERALLVWEPRRIVPSYAVPVDDLRAELVQDAIDLPEDDGRPFLSPGTPFAMHTMPGESLAVRERWRSPGGGVPAHRIRTSMATSCWTSSPSTSGPRRMSGSSVARDPLRESGSTSAAARAPGSHRGSSTGRCSRSRPARCCCSRRVSRRGTTCHARTSGWTCCDRRRRARTAPTRARRRTGRSTSATRRWKTTRGSTGPRSAMPGAVIDRVAFFNERVDIIVDGARADRPRTEFTKTGWQDGAER